LDALTGRAGRVAAAALLAGLAAALAGLAAARAGAQDAPVQPAHGPPPAPSETTPAVPSTPPSAPAAVAPDAVPAPSTGGDDQDEAETPRFSAPAPTVPARPVRSPVAILRVLDKVSAQSMAFAAPIGRRVRYKTLVFEVKACETRDPLEPGPRTSAYLIITSDAGASTAGVLARRQVYRGWMFAESPSVSPFRHPVYDAWLVSCAAEAPA
jgi:hypothetical protein